MSSIEIKNFGEKYSFRISTEQVNQYYHTLLGNPFERLKYLNFETKIYEFYRTPGIIEYFIRYYLHQGCLTNDIHIPVEILYDEFRFFGFNEQISYEILSSLITIEYYIPSGKYRRACWYRFDYQTLRSTYHPFRIVNGLMTICSMIISNIVLENSFINNRILLFETIILIYLYSKLMIAYFIRPRIRLRTFVFFIHLFALCPFSWIFYLTSSNWFYPCLVLQYIARLIRCLCLSIRAYDILVALTNDLSIYFQLFQTITLINVGLGLLIYSFERRTFEEMIWISFNAFTTLGEGTYRPRTLVGFIIEFAICCIGILMSPQMVQKIYAIISNVIEQDKFNNMKRKQTHLVLIKDEHDYEAIGQVNVDGSNFLPEILLTKPT